MSGLLASELLFLIFGFLLKWRGSAATFYGVVLWVEAAVLSLFSQFDGVEGVVDGSAVGPAPGSQQGVVQHSFDRLHRETI